MKVVKVNKNKLERTLLENREKHAAEYVEAKDSYDKSVAEWFEDNLTALENGDEYQTWYQDEQPPQDHTDDYDEAIAALEYTEDTIIELNQQEFRQYVQDKWTWRQEFVASASYYNTKAGKFGEVL